MRGAYNHGPVSHAHHGVRRGVYVGATGIDGSGFGINANTEMDEIDDASEALNKALISQLSADVAATIAAHPHLSPTELASAVATIQVQHANDPKFAFYSHEWLPWRVKWNAFAVANSSWWEKAKGIASPLIFERDRYFAAEPYRAELVGLYKKAKAMGFRTPAEPAAANEPSLPTIDDWKKYAEYGAIGLAAVLGVMVVTNVAAATRR